MPWKTPDGGDNAKGRDFTPFDNDRRRMERRVRARPVEEDRRTGDDRRKVHDRRSGMIRRD